MRPEILFFGDRPTRFINQTMNSVNGREHALPEETIAKAIQQIKDSDFTYTEINSLLKNILNGFAKESRGWDHEAIKKLLAILPHIGLKKLYPRQITENYIDAVAVTLPNNPQVTAEGGFQALIEAGIVLAPYLSTHTNKTQIDTEAIPILREELEKRKPSNREVYENLVGKIDNLDYALKTGLVKPFNIKPIDTTAIANKFKEFSNNLWYKHLSPEQFARLDSLVQEAIKDFGMNAIQIIEMSDMSKKRIYESIRRLRASGSIPDRNVYEDSLSLKVQKLLGKDPLTQQQIAHVLGPGITKETVGRAKRRLIERGKHEKNSNNQPQEKTSLQQDIINLRRQDFPNAQIANRLDIPIGRVKRLSSKLIREEKIERQNHRLGLNHPVIERAIKIDAHVDKMKSNNPGVTSKEVAEKLKLPINIVTSSFRRLKVYRQIEQLIAQGKTAAQIAQERGIDETKARFDIARLQKLRDFQRNLT